MDLCLALFAGSAVISFLDDSLQLVWGIQLLTAISGLLSFIAVLAALGVYCLMGLTPMVPKRVFLPVTLFYVAGFLAMFPVLIYAGGDWFRRTLQMDWVVSGCQVFVSLAILYWLWGGWRFRWPLVGDKRLGEQRFSWINLSVFALANVFILAPAVAAYLFLCMVLAVNHFTAGFLTLSPRGLTVHVRDYVRSDGKEVELVPMAHVADADFYRKISQSFPTNSVVLMEGVTDKKNLLTNGISYKRMAHSLGLAEQANDFRPRGELVMADVDVDQFSTNTIRLLNLVMLLHVKGVNADTVARLAECTPSPNSMRQLFDDLVKRRNQHLLKELQTELPQSQIIIMPWGAGHMPGLAKALESDGFHLSKTKEYAVIRFLGGR